MNKVLYPLPISSLEFTTEAYLDCSGVTGAACAIRYAYQVNGKVCLAGIGFKRVFALRNQSERFCMVWQVEEAFDTLIELEHSSWIEEMRRYLSQRDQDDWHPHHFMIYLDSVGCFEFLAESWVLL